MSPALIATLIAPWKSVSQRAMAAAVALAILAAAAPASAIQVQEITSPGGIKAWLVEDHSIPLLSLSLAFRGGSALDPAGKDGTSQLVAGLLDEGAGDLDSQAFQERLNDLSVDWSFDSGGDDFTGSIRTLNENRDAAFDLLRLGLTKPRFDADPVERIRGQLRSILAGDTGDPGSIASRAWWRIAYPGHPYSRQSSGTAAGLSAITAGDLHGYVKRVFARDNLIVGVVGDITPAELGLLLDKTFGDLPAKADVPEIPEAMPAGAGTTIVVDRDIPQSVVLFGQEGVKRHDADFYAAYVMNYILGGGGFTSRLTNEIREKRGLVYSVDTDLVALDHTGIIMGYLATKNESAGETLEILRKEWARLGVEGPTPEEIEDAKLYVTGSYALRFSSSQRIADILVGIQQQGFGSDYFEKRNSYVEAVTPEDVRRVAKRLLDADKLIVVVVGQPAGVTPTAPAPEGLF
jgi:zinc protease